MREQARFTQILIYKTTIKMNEITISFPNSEIAMNNFMKWFRKEGFDLFMRSRFNNISNKNDWITCFATDEKHENGYYLELE